MWRGLACRWATGPGMSLAVKQSVRSAPLGNRQSWQTVKKLPNGWSKSSGKPSDFQKDKNKKNLAAWVHDHCCGLIRRPVYANVGDSRCPIFYAIKVLTQITRTIHWSMNWWSRDKSRQMALSSSQKRFDPLDRYAKQKSKSMWRSTLARRDYLLLCSDGPMVSDEEITATIKETPVLEEAVQSLIDQANERGGVDNITVLLIKVGGERPWSKLGRR